MELEAVRNSCARSAAVYDASFGKITHAGRRAAVTCRDLPPMGMMTFLMLEKRAG